MYCTTTEQKRARVRRAWRCAEDGGTMRDFARKEGISQARVTVWVREYPDLRDRFLSNPRKVSLPEDQAERRSILLAEFRLGWRSLRSAAQYEGVSCPAMSRYLRTHEDEVLEAEADLLAGRIAPVEYHGVLNGIEASDNLRLPSNPKRALADMQAELGRGQG